MIAAKGKTNLRDRGRNSGFVLFLDIVKRKSIALARLRLLLSVTVFLAFLGTGGAQTSTGIRFGLQLPLLDSESLILTGADGTPAYAIRMARSGAGLSGGMFFQLQLGHLVVQPEIFYVWQTAALLVDTLRTTAPAEAEVMETYRRVDFPVWVGYKRGVFRIGGGPVGRLSLNNDIGLTMYEGLEESIDRLSWSVQAGIGLDLWKLHLELRYEERLGTAGEHLIFEEQPVGFRGRDRYILTAVGFSF